MGVHDYYGILRARGVMHFGISEGKGGLKHGSRPWLGMNIFWNCPFRPSFNYVSLRGRTKGIREPSMGTLFYEHFSPRGGGGGYSLIWAIQVCAAPKGMVFQPFWS